MSPTLLFWGGVVIALIAGSVTVLRRRRSYRTALLATLLSAAPPIANVLWECTERYDSEACVWGQSLLPLYLGFFLLVEAPALFLLFSLFVWGWRQLFGHRP